jgi:SNF2 family DNA or RNA helicase
VIDTLWPHQREAVAFAAERKATMLSCGMGTGKTRMALALRHAKQCRRTLIVAPLGVVTDGGWQRQAAAVDPRLAVVSLQGSNAERAEHLRWLIGQQALSDSEQPLAVVVNWDALRDKTLHSALLRAQFDLIVFDESHRAKGHDSAQSRAAYKLAKDSMKRGGLRLCLTGTPMPHSPLDLFAQMRLLDESLFGTSYYAFRQRYAVLDTRHGFPRIVGYRDREDMVARMRRVTYEVDRSVLRLPDAIHTEVMVDLPPKAREVYTAAQQAIAIEIADKVHLEPTEALVRVLRLQQLTSGFAVGTVAGIDGLIEERRTIHDIHGAKLDALRELLDMAGAEPVVVFARFRRDLDRIHEAVVQAGLTSLELSGEKKQHPDWRDGKAQVLVVQIRAGSEGVDLTRAAICVYYSATHSLGDYEQSLARVHRPGQTRTTYYYHLVVRDSVDGIMRKALDAKRDVVAGVLAELRRQVTQQTAAPSPDDYRP